MHNNQDTKTTQKNKIQGSKAARPTAPVVEDWTSDADTFNPPPIPIPPLTLSLKNASAVPILRKRKLRGKI